MTDVHWRRLYTGFAIKKTYIYIIRTVRDIVTQRFIRDLSLSSPVKVLAITFDFKF